MEELSSGQVEVRRQATQELADQPVPPKAALAALETGLADSDRDVRRLAARALGNAGGDASAVRPKLVELLRDPETAVRVSAAFAIQKIEPTSTEHIAVLKEMMKKGDGGIMLAIGDLRPAPSWAVPILIEILQDQRPGTRRIAANALERLGAAAAPAATTLKSLAQQDRDDRVREAAQLAYDSIAGQSK